MHYSCNCGFHSIIVITCPVFVLVVTEISTVSLIPVTHFCVVPLTVAFPSFLSLLFSIIQLTVVFHYSSHCSFPLFISLLFSIIHLAVVFHYFSHCCFLLFISLLFSIIHLTVVFYYFSHCSFPLFISLLFSIIHLTAVFHYSSRCCFPIIPLTVVSVSSLSLSFSHCSWHKMFLHYSYHSCSATSSIIIPIPVDRVAMVSGSKLMHPQTLAIYNYARV